MLTQTSHILIIVLLAILLPSALSFPYSIYGLKNYRRTQRASNNQPSLSATRQRYDQYRSPSSSSSSSAAAAASSSSQYYGNYDSLYDTGADNYYVDDEAEDRVPEREYLYGKPTYHGEYKPTRYYYARAPSYNYYNDHAEPTNPLDDLHEEMLQEEQHERQRNWPAGKANWFQNNGQPKSLTSNFMKNLMLYNNGINVEQPQSMDVANAYDDEEFENPYADGDISNQNEPYDYFDPLKFQSHQFNRFDSSQANKQTYFNQNNNHNENDYYTPNKPNRKQQNDYDDRDSHEDKEEKDLESLRTNQHKNSWDNKGGEKQETVIGASSSSSSKDNNKHHEDAYNGGYDTGFDYDDDEWINWDRKRSLPKKQNENLRPLKVLEYQLTRALQEQADASQISTTTTTVSPPTTSTLSSGSSSSSSSTNNINKAHEHKGQKEFVLSRPATPLRRHFSDSVLEALTKTTNEMKQSNQDDTVNHDTKEDGKQQQHNNNHSMGNKKHKRFVSSEASLVQQLNGLKRKIKA